MSFVDSRRYKVGDTVPVLTIAVVNVDGSAFSFADATGAVFVMCADDESRTEKVSETATVEPGSATGVLAYQFDTEDTDTAGKFLGVFKVTFSTGDVGTYPESGYIHIDIAENLPPA